MTSLCPRCLLPDYPDLEIVEVEVDISYSGQRRKSEAIKPSTPDPSIYTKVKSRRSDVTWVPNREKTLRPEEGFYMNNVKYVRCPAIEGAATMNRSRGSLAGGLFGKFRLKYKEDFDQPRGWIFADRDHDENGDSVSSQFDDSTLNRSTTGSSSARSVDDAESVTRFETVPPVIVGIFQKLRICLVEIQELRKAEFKKIIESNGGKIILDLVKNRVDILLVSNPTGMNFKTARAWGIACIHPTWIEKSIQAEKLLSVDKFRIWDDVENVYSNVKGAKTEGKGTTKINLSKSCFGDLNGAGCGSGSISRPALLITNGNNQDKLKTRAIIPKAMDDNFSMSTRL